MSMVGGLDLHRAQITFDVLDVDSGEVPARSGEERCGSRTGSDSGAGSRKK
jgi:hypothetical protein